MANFTRVNLRDDVENMAARFGMPEGFEARFARKPLALEKSGIGFYDLAPGVRIPFGHRHSEQEEIYVVVRGSARFKVEDEIVELRERDALRVPGPVARAFEGGPDGAEIVAFGAPFTDNKDAELVSDFWSEG
ncbi:MAG: cupin domain-containing protein [Actinomycetota bacterium]|nr:cupin domain-containing protein [Actinomycetota bacterium]